MLSESVPISRRAGRRRRLASIHGLFDLVFGMLEPAGSLVFSGPKSLSRIPRIGLGSSRL